MKMRLLLFVLSFYCFLSANSFAQQIQLQEDPKIMTVSELTILAEKANFDENITSEIHKDSRCTYFAIDRHRLDSRFLELRILEQVYSDKVVVHIGQSEPHKFMLFLANNVFNEDNGNLLNKLNTFYAVALDEKLSMNEEQLTNWIIEHDKTDIRK